MTKRFVVFNHKGGVSKTTSVYNIGWVLSDRKRVLLVDGDPQCNLTSLILRDDFDKYYIDEDTKNNNIKDGVAATFTGKPVPIQAVECRSPARAPNLFLLAGHADLSEYDAALTFAQTSNNALATLQNLPGAFSELLRLTEEKYSIDITIIDLNPGLSAINQNLFLISDAFIIPTNPDPFSLMALDTLKKVLPRWVGWKNSSIGVFSDSAYPLPAGIPKFIGTLIQRFNVRNGRAAAPYRENICEIKQKISTDVMDAFRKSGMVFDQSLYIMSDYCLGEIPDFQGLLPKAYEAGVPVFALRNDQIKETGHVLENAIDRRDKFKEKFDIIGNTILTMIEHD